MGRTYRSRVSVLLAAITATLVSIAMVHAVLSPEEGKEDVVALIVATVVLVLGYTGTFYRIFEKELVVYSFFLPLQRIEIDGITTIRATRSLLSAPALSMRRIEIRFGKHGRSVISPRCQEEFLSDLKRKNERIDIDLEH